MSTPARAGLVAGLLLASPAAIAGKPKDLPPLGAAPYAPLMDGTLDQLAAGPVCLAADARGVPALKSCAPALAALFDVGACGAAFCADAGGAPAASPGWGLTSWREGDRQVWLAVDHVVTATVRPVVRAPGAVDEAALEGLVDACEDHADAWIVTAAHLGCGKTLPLPRYTPASGPVALKDGFAMTPARGTGTFVTDLKGAAASSCSGAPVLVGVSATPLASLCATRAFPVRVRALEAQVGQLEGQLAGYHAEPDSTEDARTELFVAAEKARSGRERFEGGVSAARAVLTDARSDLGLAREEIERLEGAGDRSLVAVLTELEKLTADIGETFVDLASLDERASGLERERAGIEESARVEGLNGLQISRLRRQLDDLVGRGRGLQGELDARRLEVDALHRAVGILQGRVLVLQEARAR